MTEWTTEQSDQITSLYGKLKGEYEKKANKVLFGGPQLPYSDAFDTLTSLIKQQENEKGGLEAKVHAEQKSGIGAIAERLGKIFSGPQLAPVAATAMILAYIL
ncbi:hypothetical protein HYX08_05315 [Candidatus Woesearchaeota archaeon]|nr:hypothetical protein [Candidatus Woesearchaeota archaeon]